MKKTKFIHVKTNWRADVLFIIGEFSSVDKWAKKNMIEHIYKKKKHMFQEDKDPSCDGSMFPMVGGGSIIWLKRESLGVVVHEIFHAVHEMLSDKGMELNDDTQEAYCYLFQYLFEEYQKGI